MIALCTISQTRVALQVAQLKILTVHQKPVQLKTTVHQRVTALQVAQLKILTVRQKLVQVKTTVHREATVLKAVLQEVQAAQKAAILRVGLVDAQAIQSQHVLLAVLLILLLHAVQAAHLTLHHLAVVQVGKAVLAEEVASQVVLRESVANTIWE